MGGGWEVRPVPDIWSHLGEGQHTKFPVNHGSAEAHSAACLSFPSTMGQKLPWSPMMAGGAAQLVPALRGIRVYISALA